MPRAVERCAEAGLELRGLHAHIGSQVFELEAFEAVAEVLRGLGDWPLLNLGGGLGIAYTADDEPPSIEAYVEALLRHVPEGVKVLCEPGRSLVGNAGVTVYTVGTVKRVPGVRTWVAVDGGMSDNLRPMLYDARYEAEIVGRFGGARGVHGGRHALRVRATCSCATCRSTTRGPGDLLVIPATGAYGYSMANNYNAVRRPAGGLLQGRRRAPGGPARDLRRSDPS